jgi:hypothetical protein
VASYYEPLIVPQIIGRHYFWANFYINPLKIETRGHMESTKNLAKIKGFEGINDRTLLRNCVEPELGLHIFQEAFREYKTLI